MGEANNMEVNLAVLAGDGVGPEVMAQALNMLQAVGEKFGHSFSFNEGLAGGVVIDTPGEGLSYEPLCVIVGWAKAELERRIIWKLI
jgi:isocitrate/isopropylmalate dehydrogenase